MKKIKARYIWITIGVLFLIAIGLIFAVQKTTDVLNKICLVSLIVVFILITILIQVASVKSFSGKKLIKYKEKEYKTDISNLEDNLLNLKYKRTKRSFGNTYLLIKDKIAYKVSFIESSINYFTNSGEDDVKPNKELDSCKAFIGIEIFNEIDEENIDKLKEFTIQTKNVYYTSIVKLDNGNYKCLNYDEPNDNHKEFYNNLFNDLGLIEIEKETVESK